MSMTPSGPIAGQSWEDYWHSPVDETYIDYSAKKWEAAAAALTRLAESFGSNQPSAEVAGAQDAIALFEGLVHGQTLTPYAQWKCMNASKYLRMWLDRHFSGPKPPDSLNAALSEIKRAGTLLLEAGQVLEAAATRFNKNGDSHGAGKTMQAAKKYQAEAKGFLGEELG